MTMEEKIKAAAAYGEKSLTAIGKDIFDKPQQNICSRVKKGKFSQEELEAIAAYLGAEWHSYFEFKDGVKIGK